MTVTDPESNQTRYTFGIRFNVTEGQLQKTEEGWNGSTAVKTITRQYAALASGSWPDPVGQSLQPRGNGYFASRLAPENFKVTAQQGATFSWQATTFDQFAKPTDVTRSSSLGWNRRDLTVYDNNFTKWVLSQPQTLTDYATGMVVEQNTYDPATANKLDKRSFGRVLESYTYYGPGEPSPGALKTRTDARGKVTVLSNYKRGLAQSAAYADGSSESAVVHDNGSIASVTNAAGATTSYGYDAMGRLSAITYPGGDAVAYQPTTFSYAQVGSDEYGVTAGHWRLTKATGNALSTTYFDGQWRPVMSRTWDAANEAGTRRVTITRYDSAGRKIFESYPQRDIASINAVVDGTTSSYDALGRITQQLAKSELGNLSTVTEYLAGFQRRVTNPRGYATTQAFQAFDEPTQDSITQIWAPEGVGVVISRDTFGKATAITRSGGGKSLTRSYVYDGNQRLCKTVEPETGATVVAYEGNSDLTTWRASGLSLPAATCDLASVPAARKINFTYDDRGRLKTTTYGDGSPTVTRSYTPDGLLQSITTQDALNPTTWNYGYNNRRQLWWEQFGAWGGVWWFTHNYDANGNEASVQDQLGTMTYAPNALGQPTQVSGYASNVSYHPNGAVAGFTYANNVVHKTEFNARGLPQLIENSGQTRLSYTYDANGNVASLTDALAPQYSRRMDAPGAYDGLDRLRQVNQAGGAAYASYGYDSLDNLVASNVNGRNLTHNIDAATNRLSSLSGTNVVGFAYDANGNVTTRGTQGFVFDIGNRMSSAVGKASYVYDGHGRRSVSRYAGGYEGYYAYTQDGKLRMSYVAQTNGNEPGGFTRYVYLGGKLIAEHNGTPLYVYSDALGSPIAKHSIWGTDATRYEPYGSAEPGTFNPVRIGFTGHVNDPNTGLVYMQQRYCDPWAGRFLSVDPVVTDVKTGDFFGRYHYALNNPYTHRDPDGRCACYEIPHDAGVAGGLGIGDVVRGPAAAQIAAASVHIGAPTMASGAALAGGAISGGKDAAAALPQMKGMGTTERAKTLGDAGFQQTKVSSGAGKNETWSHKDGSQVRVHPYGNQNQGAHASGNNAHLHKQDAQGNQLNDRGAVSTDKSQTHIGLPNPQDFQTVRGRPNGS